VTTRRSLGCLIEIAQTLVLTLVLFWIVQSFVAQPFQVRQVSMQHTIENGQYVLVDKLTPRFDPYHRGDIVVFAPPDNAETRGGEPFIKRIVGIAGDSVELREGEVYVNDVALVEPYLYSGADGVTGPTDPEGPDTTWTIEPGSVFVMGDHRQRSSDSRAFGPISIDSVIGRAWLRYWPLDDFGILPTAPHPELAGSQPHGVSGRAPAAPATSSDGVGR
jgi:signal peptidase I